MQERWGSLRASVSLGAIWGLWHSPLLISALRSNAPLGRYLVGIIGTSILLTWIFNGAPGHSVGDDRSRGHQHSGDSLPPDLFWWKTTSTRTGPHAAVAWAAVLIVIVATRAELGMTLLERVTLARAR
jgi:hypothetical protein